MNAVSGAVTILLVIAIVLIVTVAIAPILVQDLTNESVGSGDTAGGNIWESLDKFNRIGEDSALDRWLDGLDEVNN